MTFAIVLIEKPQAIPHTQKIKYQLWRNGILDELDREVDFEFRIPVTYDTYDEAEKDENMYYTKPTQLESGEVVFETYKKGKQECGINSQRMDELVDTIHWQEHWKYKCLIVKEEGIKKTLSELFPNKDFGKTGNMPCSDISDYEPYAEKFENMYKKYLTKNTLNEVCKYAIQCVAYGVNPVFRI